MYEIVVIVNKVKNLKPCFKKKFMFLVCSVPVEHFLE